MDEFEIIEDKDVNKMITDELANIIMRYYGVNILHMNQKDLNEFLLHIIKRKEKHSNAKLIKQICIWAIQQGVVRIILPGGYYKFCLKPIISRLF